MIKAYKRAHTQHLHDDCYLLNISKQVIFFLKMRYSQLKSHIYSYIIKFKVGSSSVCFDMLSNSKMHSPQPSQICDTEMNPLASAVTLETKLCYSKQELQKKNKTDLRLHFI